MERNRIDVFGYECRFVRCLCGSLCRQRVSEPVFGVFLNDVFVGTIQAFVSNGWNFVALTPNASCTVIRGTSRVKAVAQYVLTYLLCNSPFSEVDK